MCVCVRAFNTYNNARCFDFIVKFRKSLKSDKSQFAFDDMTSRKAFEDVVVVVEEEDEDEDKEEM